MRLRPIFEKEKVVGWRDEERNRDYRRIWGGLAWPQVHLPGFAVAVAEEFTDPGQGGVRVQDSVSMHILLEAESSDFNTLMRACTEHSNKVTWWGNVFDKTNMLRLQDFNLAETGAGRPRLVLFTPPLVSPEGDLKTVVEHGVARILQRTGSSKTLVIGDNPMVQACRDGLRGEAEDSLHDHPRLLALCFVLNALDRIPWVHPATERKPWVRERIVPG
jgi:hypothetical protein